MNDLMDITFWSKILFSIVCGLIIGTERQLKGKPVGIRTSILICLSTMFFITFSLELDLHNSPSRVLGQLVTGVGFLGAGVIMTKGDIVTGVTSASVVWLLASLGAAIGLGYGFKALTICLVALSVLSGVQWLEKISYLLRKGVYKSKDGQ